MRNYDMGVYFVHCAFLKATFSTGKDTEAVLEIGKTGRDGSERGSANICRPQTRETRAGG